MIPGWIGLHAKPFLLGAAGFFSALLLSLLGYHLWTDHMALHTMLGFLNEHAEKIRALPPGQ